MGQAVLGVLGCPNLPHARLRDEDVGAGAAELGDGQVGGVGTLFTATRGAGAFAGPLAGGLEAPGRLDWQVNAGLAVQGSPQGLAANGPCQMQETICRGSGSSWRTFRTQEMHDSWSLLSKATRTSHLQGGCHRS